jgi:hypothetical protein
MDRPRPVRAAYIDLTEAPSGLDRRERDVEVADLIPDPGPGGPQARIGQPGELLDADPESLTGQPSAPARRTIRIQGRGAERNLPWPGEASRRRAPRTLHERAGLRPDRVAMWAMFLGLLLVVVAALSGHG